MLKKYIIIALAPLILFLSGCVYKMDIHQGNVIKAEQSEQLKIGMSKREVLALLGSPMVADPFHVHRWDYFSLSKTKNQNIKKQSLITLHFEGDTLSKIDS